MKNLNNSNNKTRKTYLLGSLSYSWACHYNGYVKLQLNDMLSSYTKNDCERRYYNINIF